ncbi:MAG: murein biosynthesis integral membrane protein MurJ [Mycobacteriales bacterium]
MTGGAEASGVEVPRPPAGVTPQPGIGRSSRIVAIGSAASRLTGFLRTVAISTAIGAATIGDAYNTANTLPNIVYELLIGGVLTSVVVPLLVHAQHQESDGGEAYAQRLMCVTTVLLALVTVVAVVLAPQLTSLYGVLHDPPQVRLANFLARLLLVEIVFYGVGSMLGAILNIRGVFGAPAWAPVLNNVVVIATGATFYLMPGPHTLSPLTITTAQVLVLGVGTTLGIVVQAVVLIPAARRVGFRWRWRFDLRRTGLREAGTLGLWVIAYVLVSQAGYVVITRLANAAGRSSHIGYSVYTYQSLLFQMPYGIIGVALLTALLPRMSRAAATGDTRRVVSDLSLGARLTAVGLVPVTAAYIVLGPAIGTLVFRWGRTTPLAAHEIGVALAWGAFGLLPFAVTLLQLRAFYAMKDARTPTVINAIMVVIRIVLCLAVPHVVAADHVVAGLAFANSLSFVPGVIIGEIWLRARFGRLDTTRVVRTVIRLTVASAIGGVVAWLARLLAADALGSGHVGVLAQVAAGSVLGGGVAVLVAVRLRIEELTGIVTSLRRVVAR